MACGTPVIAMRRGSLPEIIDHGFSGFLVDNLDEAIVAIGQIGTIDRRLTRKFVEQRFSVERMATEYLELYGRILSGQGARHLELAIPA
jgi:glycosyltransferase involved in cell wall biosynthesis